MILTPTKTLAGRTATFNAAANGLSLTLTHIAIGDGGGAPSDDRSALRSERERVSCFGSRVSPDQIHLDAMFNGDWQGWVREIGIFAGPTLVYYWSTAGAELGYKSAGFEWLVGLDLALDQADQAAIAVAALPPNIGLTVAPFLATVLKSMCDTNMLVLKNHYLN